MRGLVVTAAGERFVIPQVNLLELVQLEGAEAQKQIEWIHGTPVHRRRGNLLPLVYLERILAVSIVVVQAEDRQFGLVVDTINDTQEIAKEARLLRRRDHHGRREDRPHP